MSKLTKGQSKELKMGLGPRQEAEVHDGCLVVSRQDDSGRWMAIWIPTKYFDGLIRLMTSGTVGCRLCHKVGQHTHIIDRKGHSHPEVEHA
jgi:hypothetical protein